MSAFTVSSGVGMVFPQVGPGSLTRSVFAHYGRIDTDATNATTGLGAGTNDTTGYGGGVSLTYAGAMAAFMCGRGCVLSAL
ncbi:hypothetical protein [Nitratireductor sp. XY-223]|uniref:hypothetical protein n=1 Tax=Hyphomicrobiales TaxID=356 RepID=UPI0010A9F139|nr:hypothetical protein [Nitratireductor sp. XY-223]